VLAAEVPAGEELFNLAALVVLCSILAHGLTDTAGAEWIARRRGPTGGAYEADAIEAATSSGRE
jgi:hypothetical protein